MRPPTVVRRFERIAPDTRDYGAYNKLLSGLFPVESVFTVIPRPYERTETTGPYGFITLEVLLQKSPVFLIEVEGPQGISSVSACKTADQQIRRHMWDLIGNLYSHYKIQKFYA